MYTQILKEILFDIHFHKKSIKDFTNYCRNQFANNEKELNIIDIFERKYHKFKAIWWYTNECFLHRMLNRALRMMKIDIIIKMGFFVCDLHCHIEELHKKQYNDPDQIQSFIVYRGQGLSKTDFNRMIKTKGGLISFNNFLSSSKKQNIALIYARHATNDSDLIGVVFKMMIDPLISSTPFALINDVSFFKESEQEILFSMHTIFCIGDIHQIEFDNNQVWEVELTLTSDSDQQFNKLIQRMREESQGSKGWFRAGQLLIKLGQFDKAGELYNVLLNQTSNKIEIGYIYHQLGWIEVNLGNYTEAISFFEKSLVIGGKILPLYHPDLATCYDNIGLVYDHMGKYINALSSHEKALEIYRATLLSDHPDLATSLSNIGLVYSKLNEYSKALLSHEEALKIYQKKLPSNHSSLAVSYNNIGLVYDKMNDYSTALWFYDKTLEIYRNTMPSDHPDLAISHQNIGKALEKMCEYSKALSSHEKALVIFQTNFPCDHPYLATCYNYIASVYNNMSEYSKALSFYEKALDIRQKLLPPYHPDLITLYNSMADVYDRMNEYSQALLFYQKLFEICQSNLASDDLLLASVYYKIAKVYCNMGCYNKALPYVEHAFNIGQRALPPNYSDLQTYSITLALVKTML
jgi:tetratricopeptide (TPR) repeat protein